MNSFYPPVLDPCCGSRMMYFNKQDPRVLFCDNRTVRTTLCDGRELNISPDMLCDFRDLPFVDGTFPMVVFDPPHLTQGGQNSWIIKKYGKLPAQGWKEYLKEGFQECWRVLREKGTLIFKWSEEQIPVGDICDLFPTEPCYGNLARDKRQIFLVFHKGDNHEEIRKIGFPEETPKKKGCRYPLTLLQMPENHSKEKWRETLTRQYTQALKDTQPGGCLILQWNQQERSQQEIISAIPEAPLFGNRAKGDRTVFLVFNK